MSYESAEIVQTAEGKQYHTGVKASDLAPYLLLCGDPARAYRVAEYFDDAREPICNREYVSITGRYKDVPVTVMATGMGPDNTEMAVVEISQLLKSPTYIRIGTCGALQDGMKIGDQIISTGAYRGENTSLGYVGEGYPAVPHVEVTMALLEAAQQSGHPYHMGITATAPGFYGAQGRTVPGFTPRNPNITEELAAMNVVNFEMEASCLFTLSSVSGARAGCVCGAVASRTENRFVDESEKSDVERRTIEIGLHAVTLVAQMDQRKDDAQCWLPSMGLA